MYGTSPAITNTGSYGQTLKLRSKLQLKCVGTTPAVTNTRYYEQRLNHRSKLQRNNSCYYELPLLRTEAKFPVETTKKCMETTSAITDTRYYGQELNPRSTLQIYLRKTLADTDSRHYRKTPAEEHSRTNI